MKTRHVLAQAIAITIAGCVNSGYAIPGGSNAVAQMHPLRMLFEKAKSDAYQWVTVGNGAAEYDYPRRITPVGAISGLNSPGGECSSGKSTFWIVNSGDDDLINYSYNGKKTLKTLSVTAGTPGGCAVSVNNGDVAVTLFPGNAIVIFRHGKQSGKEIENGLQQTYFNGYDGKNDLFVDGFNESNSVAALVEMAAGSTRFKNVSLPNAVEFPGSVQFDGKYVAVTDQETNDIYRYAIANDVAKLEGTVKLSDAYDCGATWIAEPYVFCADAGLEEVNVYKYPAGGTSIATLKGSSSYAVQSIVQVST